MRLLTDLSASLLVSSSDMAGRCWYKPSVPRAWSAPDDPVWYYHGPRLGPSSLVPDALIDTVDPELREIVSLMHQFGIATTPSCQGHHHTYDTYSRLWHVIVSDGLDICDNGLPVIDVESGQVSLFRNKKYKLPWPGFDVFYVDVSSKQAVGYLGFYLSDPLRDLFRPLLGVGSVSSMVEEHVGPSSSLFALSVRTTSDELQAIVWREWLALFRDVLASF